MKASVRTISELTGFSPATVSNALNYKKGVNKDTAKEIFRVAKELGYSTDPRVTKIKFLCCKRHGHIINDSPFFPAVIEGAEAQAKELGYETVFINLDMQSPEYSKQIEKILEDTTCSAFILLGTELKEEDYKIFSTVKAPLMLIDGGCEEYVFDSVLISNADSAQRAVTYLIEKGHTKIGYLRGKHRINAFLGRAKGYRRALKNKEIPLDKHFVVTVGTTSESAFTDMELYLQGGGDLPTAFFADNDIIALGAIKALQRHGYKVPEDVSVIGFDDLAFCEISSPRLTTIRVHKQEMGKIAVRRLADHINFNSRVKTKILVYTDFIERDSVKDISKRGK